MKKTLREFYGTYFPGKMHLFHLPPCENLPQWQGDSTELCVVIPVFSMPENPTAVADFILQSGIWSLRCWRENTHAQALDIPCFLYIESSVMDMCAPILAENNVPESAVLTFENNPAFQGPEKKMNAFIDERLQAYKKVLVSDVDTFPIAGLKKHSILNRIIDESISANEIGIAACMKFSDTTLQEEAPYWIAESKSHFHTWKDLVRSIAPENHEQIIANYETDQGIFAYPWAAFYLFQPEGIPAHREMLMTLAEGIDDDEFVISLLDQVTDISLYDAHDRFGLRFIFDLMTQEFIDYHHSDKAAPIMLHAHQSADFGFQKMIGCL